MTHLLLSVTYLMFLVKAYYYNSRIFYIHLQSAHSDSKNSFELKTFRIPIFHSSIITKIQRYKISKSLNIDKFIQRLCKLRILFLNLYLLRETNCNYLPFVTKMLRKLKNISYYFIFFPILYTFCTTVVFSS